MSISEKQIEAFNRKAEAIASDNTLLEYVKEDYPTFHRNLIEDGLREQGFEVEDDDFEMGPRTSRTQNRIYNNELFRRYGLS